MTTLIRLEAEIVATVGVTRYYLAPRIKELPKDDPIARIVDLMCAYALDVQAGRLPGPYSDDLALGVARRALAELERGADPSQGRD